MLTGDNRTTADAVARRLGIEEVEAEVLPDQKAAVVERHKAAGQVVAMAGDGVNDAPALAAADVGIAMGTGTDVAIESAGLTLLKGDLVGIVRARRLSRAVMGNIRQNLFFAFVYNAAGVPVAAGILYPFLGILLSPVIAAAAMALSSVSVIGNALRLQATKLDPSSAARSLHVPDLAPRPRRRVPAAGGGVRPAAVGAGHPPPAAHDRDERGLAGQRPVRHGGRGLGLLQIRAPRHDGGAPPRQGAGEDPPNMTGTPFPVMVGKGALHCGSGCMLGDVAAEWLAFLVPAVAVWFGWHSLFEEKMYAVWVLDFVFAYALGIVFQYYAIVPMRGSPPRGPRGGREGGHRLADRLAGRHVRFHGLRQFYLSRTSRGNGRR